MGFDFRSIIISLSVTCLLYKNEILQFLPMTELIREIGREIWKFILIDLRNSRRFPGQSKSKILENHSK